MATVTPNEHFIHWKYHQKYDGSEETTCVPQLRHIVSDTKLNSHIHIKRTLRRLHRKFGVLMYIEYRETTYMPQLRHNVSDKKSYIKGPN